MARSHMTLLLLAVLITLLMPRALAQLPDAPVPAEIVGRLPHSVGNVTFTPDKRIIYSQHPFFKPDIRVVEITSASTFKPFPDLAWNTPRPGTDQYFDSVLGLRGDENGIIWILDMGTRIGLTPKIVAWNSKRNALERIYYIPAPASIPESQLNDLVVDNKHGAIFIADEAATNGADGSKGALVVVDMVTGACRRVLEGQLSTKAENVPITVDGRKLTVKSADGKTSILKIGADGIAADKDFFWLYYGPLNGHSLYRLKIDDLLNTSLSDKELDARVERYSDKPNNGGLSMDSAGNIYSTAVESRAVGIIGPDRKYRVFTRDQQMIWPDGVSYSPDGYMYVSAAQVSEAEQFNEGQARNKAPYLLYRFKPLAPGRIGH